MIEIFFFNSGDEYADISSYIFGGIVGLMGIVGAILLFVVERKISQIASSLDNLNDLYANNDLSYNKFKMRMAIYALEWKYASYDRWFKILLIVFFLPSFILVETQLYVTCNSINLIFIFLTMPLITFSLIIYELIFAPDTIIFDKWRPSKLITSRYPFNEIAEKYYGYLDIEDLQKLECNRFMNIKLTLYYTIDKSIIFYLNIKNYFSGVLSNKK